MQKINTHGQFTLVTTNNTNRIRLVSFANDSNDFDDIDRDIVGEQNIILKDASDICAGDTGKETEDVNVDGE